MLSLNKENKGAIQPRVANKNIKYETSSREGGNSYYALN